MKKLIVFGALILLAHFAINAMEEQKSEALTFFKAEEGEDLSTYQDILLQVYSEYANDDAVKRYLKTALPRSFEVLASWIGKKGKVFIKAHYGQKPVGFLTLESLNDDDSKIAFHQSPLLKEYLNRSPDYFAAVKQEFPNAKFVYTACSNKVSKMQALIKGFGFEEDPSYLPTKELVPNPEGFMGYKKSLN